MVFGIKTEFACCGILLCIRFSLCEYYTYQLKQCNNEIVKGVEKTIEYSVTNCAERCTNRRKQHGWCNAFRYIEAKKDCQLAAVDDMGNFNTKLGTDFERQFWVNPEHQVGPMLLIFGGKYTTFTMGITNFHGLRQCNPSILNFTHGPQLDTVLQDAWQMGGAYARHSHTYLLCGGRQDPTTNEFSDDCWYLELEWPVSNGTYARQWENVKMFQPRKWPSLTAIGNKIYILGGQVGNSSENSVEIFDANPDVFTMTRVLVNSQPFLMYPPDRKARFCAVTIDEDRGWILIVGGSDGVGQMFNDATILDVNQWVWLPIAPLPEPKKKFACGLVHLDGEPYVVAAGGETKDIDNNVVPSAKVFKISVKGIRSAAWTSMAVLPIPVSQPLTTVAQIGGPDLLVLDPTSNSIFVHHHGNGTWSAQTVKDSIGPHLFGTMLLGDIHHYDKCYWTYMNY